MKSSVIVYTQLHSFGGIEYLFIQLAKFLKKKKLKNTRLVISPHLKIGRMNYQNLVAGINLFSELILIFLKKFQLLFFININDFR